MTSYTDFKDGRIKHLEMIQAVVARLANEAALVRGWAVTVAAAFYGFAAKNLNWRIAAVGLLPVVAFWWLNVYYLWSEQKYRCLGNRVARAENAVEPFSMDASNEAVPITKAMRSPVVWPFYLVMAAVGGVLIVAGLLRD
jgi:hypothetical protein